MPRVIVAITFLLLASTRVSDPSPWFKVQIEPPPGVRKRGFGPTGIEPRTSPVTASTAVKTFRSTPVIQTISSLKSGLKEPDGIEIFCWTALVFGLTRVSVPFSSVTIQTLSRLTAIPPSALGGPNGRLAMILLVRESRDRQDGALFTFAQFVGISRPDGGRSSGLTHTSQRCRMMPEVVHAAATIETGLCCYDCFLRELPAGAAIQTRINKGTY